MKRVRAILLMLATCLAAAPAVCQSAPGAMTKDDLQLLRNAQHVDHRYDDRRVVYGFTPGRRTLNPVYHTLSVAMYAYQKALSPVLQRRCAYVPSCSAYSKALLKRYGLLKGTICTADRLVRCNRVSLADHNALWKLSEGHGHIHETTDRYQ